MNERILEFAKQTGLCDADGDFFGGKISQYDEFAQLIIRESIIDFYRNYLDTTSNEDITQQVERYIKNTHTG
jgi:hypothetical protein